MSHIVKATELKLFAKFHDDWSKQAVLNATSPNYANYEVTHALTCLRSPNFCLHQIKPALLWIFSPFPLRPPWQIRQSGSHDEVEVLLLYVFPKYQSTWLAPMLVLRHHQKGLAPQTLGSHNASNERDQIFPTPCGFGFRNFYGSRGSRVVRFLLGKGRFESKLKGLVLC